MISALVISAVVVFGRGALPEQQLQKMQHSTSQLGALASLSAFQLEGHPAVRGDGGLGEGAQYGGAYLDGEQHHQPQPPRATAAVCGTAPAAAAPSKEQRKKRSKPGQDMTYAKRHMESEQRRRHRINERCGGGRGGVGGGERPDQAFIRHSFIMNAAHVPVRTPYMDMWAPHAVSRSAMPKKRPTCRGTPP